MSIFFSSKCRLFHNATLFGFCITHILNTGCALKFEKNSVVKRLIRDWIRLFLDVKRKSVPFVTTMWEPLKYSWLLLIAFTAA